MKQIIQGMLSLTMFSMVVFIGDFTCITHAGDSPETVSVQNKKEIFENKISDIAERYIGMPSRFGKDLEKSLELDNSHLLGLIYAEAAKKAGLRFKGYMPMKELLRNTVEIQRDELKNGDLIVLNDGHAALIYKVGNRDNFHMIYVSLERRQVISFNSQNIVFEVYWLKNLKGFFRLTESMFVSND